MTLRRWSDRWLEDSMGVLLRGGVVLAAAIVAVGGAFFLVRHGGGAADYRVFHGEPAALCSIRGILTDALAGHGRGVVQLGLLALIATPVARVAWALVGFVLQRDRVYATIALVVLAVLAFSLMAHPS